MSGSLRGRRMPLALPDDRCIGRGRLWAVRVVVGLGVLGTIGVIAAGGVGAIGYVLGLALLYWALLRALSRPTDETD